MAGVNLKILCKTHWSKVDDRFEEPQLSNAEKDELKEHIPSALADPTTKIRTLVVRQEGVERSTEHPTSEDPSSFRRLYSPSPAPLITALKLFSPLPLRIFVGLFDL